MEVHELFYSWVPRWIRIPVMIMIYTVLLSANGVYTGNINETFSYFGNAIEPYTAASYAMYIGMALGYMINLRIRARFTSKALLLFALAMMLFMNIICATTSNGLLTIIACLMLGITKILGLTELFLKWLSIWSKELDRSRLYPYLYFSALAGLYGTVWLTSRIAYDFTWQYAYIPVLILILCSIMAVIIFTENVPLIKKIPLYQLDLIGFVLLAITMLLLDYVIVYGKVEDWLESGHVVSALFLIMIFGLLFIKRELTFKRPLLPFSLFKLGNFRTGLLFFFLLGIFVPVSLQSSFITGSLGYESFRNAETGLYLIPGILAGCIICYFWYYKKYDPQLLIIIGFILVVAYYVIMYYSYGTVYSIQFFWLSSTIKGLGLSFLYIAIGLYISNGHKLNDVLTVVGAGILVRSFIGSATFTALYTYFIYAQGVRHFNYLTEQIDSNLPAINGLSGSVNVNSTIQQQAQLGALKEITGYIIIAGIFIILITSLHLIYSYSQRLKTYHIRQKWDWKHF
jgi:DHA2 family multidrug resistance protein